MYLELKHLRTLEALSEYGSLAGAAERLHLTQSALSHQLKALEDYLGSPLFLRKSRPLRLTPAGEALLSLAAKVLPEVEAAEHALKRIARGEAGRLHIALECHSCFEWLIPTLDAYRPHWPQVELDLSLGFSFEPLPALARAEIDLVITSDPRPLPGLVYEPLFDYEALLAMASTHPLAVKARIRPEDLAGETLITYPVERRRLDIFTRFLDPAGIAPARVRSAELTVMMIQLIASGRGLCALPDWALAEYLTREDLTARPLGAGMHATLYAALREREHAQPYMQAFLETARDITRTTLTHLRAQQTPPGP